MLRFKHNISHSCSIITSVSLLICLICATTTCLHKAFAYPASAQGGPSKFISELDEYSSASTLRRKELCADAAKAIDDASLQYGSDSYDVLYASFRIAEFNSINMVVNNWSTYGIDLIRVGGLITIPSKYGEDIVFDWRAGKYDVKLTKYAISDSSSAPLVPSNTAPPREREQILYLPNLFLGLVIYGSVGFTSILIYFLPAIIAYRRAHKEHIAIAILVLLTGWTFIGWVVAMVWAYTTDIESGSSATSPVNKECQFCAETIMAAAVVCRYCGRDLVTKI